MTGQIRCPHCRAEFEVTAAVAEQLREQVRRDFDAEARLREEALARREGDFDKTLRERLASERPKLVDEARVAFAQQLIDRDAQLAEVRGRLDMAHALELQLRKDARELDDQKRELELTVQRTLDAERTLMQDRIRQEISEDHRLKVADKEKHIDDLRRQIDELKRKAEQGAPSIQGEVMELELEEFLRGQFPQDDIEAVPVGVHGGDLIQRVRDSHGLACGTILWESKRTKTWVEAWLPKLRDDQIACGAELSAILSAQLPKGMATFGCVDGLWITNRSCLPGLAAALRAGLIEVARTRRSLEGRQTKADHLVGYLCSAAFRLTIESMVELYDSMKEDLNLERRAHQKMWLKREKQIEHAIGGITGIVGELGCILGASLPAMALLEPGASWNAEPVGIPALTGRSAD